MIHNGIHANKFEALKFYTAPAMSSRPSRVCQPSARLINPSNKADLQLKSHRDVVEKARAAAELEKAHASNPQATPPPQLQSAHGDAVPVDLDDHNASYPEVSDNSQASSRTSPRVPTHSEASSEASAGSQVPTIANKHARATSDKSDNNEASDISENISASVKSRKKRKKQKTHSTSEFIHKTQPRFT